MPQLAKRLPCRKSELVSWPAGPNGSYLVRNRQSGDTFQIGEPERYLLGRLNGRHTAQEVCTQFADRFGESLTAGDLADFLALAEERGFLQSVASDCHLSTDGFEETPPPQRLRQGRLQVRRVAARLLAAFAAPLQGLAGLLQGTAQKLHWLRLKHIEYVPRADDVFIVTY